jgi:hypothetical protein
MENISVTIFFVLFLSLVYMTFNTVTVKESVQKERIAAEVTIPSPQCRRFINTRKYQVDCRPVVSSLYPLLVTGLGGSGTHESAAKLIKKGLDLPHEVLGVDGSVVSDSSLLANCITHLCFYSWVHLLVLLFLFLSYTENTAT